MNRYELKFFNNIEDNENSTIFIRTFDSPQSMNKFAQRIMNLLFFDGYSYKKFKQGS